MVEVRRVFGGGNLRVLTKICMMVVVLSSKWFDASRGYDDVERLKKLLRDEVVQRIERLKMIKSVGGGSEEEGRESEGGERP
jgi:hypothetical protein